MVTVLAGSNTNIGAVRSTVIPLLKQVLDPLCSTLIRSLAPDSGESWHEDVANSPDENRAPQGYYQ